MCVCVSACVCVCLSVFETSEILGTGHRSVMLSPTWKASPCELCQLVLQLVYKMGGSSEEAFKTFLQVTCETIPFTLQQYTT